MKTAPLCFDQVSFRHGKKAVLESFSLALHAGEVALLAAPNGAGKTTALWLAAGLYAPAGGGVTVQGRDPFSDRAVLGQVGFVAEGAPLPPSWTGAEVLDFQKATFPRWDAAEVARLVAAFGLDPSAKVKTLSRGQRGKLALVCALGTRPEVLLLDEATLGLDVATRRLIAGEVLGRVAEDGCAVLMSSHEIAEAERAADRLVLLDRGRASCDEAVSSLLERHRILSWDGDVLDPPAALSAQPLPSPLGHRAIALAWSEDAARPWLASGGRAEPADLETIYLSLTGETAVA